MDDNYLRINKIRTVINIFTAVVFSLFTAYHIYLLFNTEANRFGRVFGLIPFILLIAASVFALIPVPAFRIIRTVFMIAGLSLYIAVRFVNASAVFGRMDFADIPSVLNCAIFVFSQAAKLVLLFYYVVFRRNQKLNSKRKAVIVLMLFVIVMYVLCLILECVLILKYGSNIDLSRKFTLISRFLYCSGFVSIAVSFMLPVREIQDPNDSMNQPADDDLLLSTSETNQKKPKNKNKNKRKRLPTDYDDDFVL